MVFCVSVFCFLLLCFTFPIVCPLFFLRLLWLLLYFVFFVSFPSGWVDQRPPAAPPHSGSFRHRRAESPQFKTSVSTSQLPSAALHDRLVDRPPASLPTSSPSLASLERSISLDEKASQSSSLTRQIPSPPAAHTPSPVPPARHGPSPVSSLHSNHQHSPSPTPAQQSIVPSPPPAGSISPMSSRPPAVVPSDSSRPPAVLPSEGSRPPAPVPPDSSRPPAAVPCLSSHTTSPLHRSHPARAVDSPSPVSPDDDDLVRIKKG